MYNVVLLTCTYNRHKCSERILRFFMEDTYEGKMTLLIYNNSFTKEDLDWSVLTKDWFQEHPNKTILLINEHKDWKNVGEIFNDAIRYIPEDTDIVTHYDVDDVFLPNHITEGVRGMNEAYNMGKLGYKPHYSYFWTNGLVEKKHNTFEPSIFIDWKYLKKTGYLNTVTDYNQSWEQGLRRENLLHDKEEGIPTLIYDWSGLTGVHKISGGSNDVANYDNHRKYSGDLGDGVITPITKDEAKFYFNLVK